jgi:hypothetical protein
MAGLSSYMGIQHRLDIRRVSKRANVIPLTGRALTRSSTGFVSALPQWLITQMALKTLLNLGAHVAAESGLSMAIREV